MTNLLRFDFNDRDGIFEVVENGDWVRATDYDALAAKLAEVEADTHKIMVAYATAHAAVLGVAQAMEDAYRSREENK